MSEYVSRLFEAFFLFVPFFFIGTIIWVVGYNAWKNYKLLQMVRKVFPGKNPHAELMKIKKRVKYS